MRSAQILFGGISQDSILNLVKIWERCVKMCNFDDILGKKEKTLVFFPQFFPLLWKLF